MLLSSLLGCASASSTFNERGDVIGGTSFGFGRDLEIHQVRPDGSEIIIKSRSTTSDAMRAGNEILGTAAGIASKMAP